MAATAHVVLPGSRRGLRSGAKAIGAADPKKWVEVTVKVRRKAPLPAVTDRPATTISRQDLGDLYGAAPQDLQKVEAAFKPYGLEVVESNAATRTVRLGGPVNAMEKAFDVRLLRYAHERGTYRGRVGEIQIPADLKDVVVGVFGLDNRPVVKKRTSHATTTSVARPKPAKPGALPTAQRKQWFFPADLASIYQFPPGDGTNQSIGLLEFGGGFFASDLQQFCQAAGVSVPNVVPISVNNAATDAHDGAEDEVMLDVEVVAGVCPKATIAVYFSQFTEQGWVDILDAAVHDQTNAPMVLSVSWGMAEDDPSWSQGAIDQINESLQEAALAGITVCVAAGDDGSADQDEDGHAHVDFPSSSPFVLAVGGTTLHVRQGGPMEVVWKDGDGTRVDGGGSTGGGVSVHFPRPSWQNVDVPSVNPRAIDGRVIPDVAAEAESDGKTTGYFMVVDGKSGLNGGTSASAPLWAALIARMNAALGKPVGYITPLLYKSVPGGTGTIGAAGCTDITSGDNDTATVGGYSAGTGFDAASGWGSPLGNKLMAALKSVM